jgi:hypothetical protein
LRVEPVRRIQQRVVCRLHCRLRREQQRHFDSAFGQRLEQSECAVRVSQALDPVVVCVPLGELRLHRIEDNGIPGDCDDGSERHR